jgi:hypothetical protein
MPYNPHQHPQQNFPPMQPGMANMGPGMHAPYPHMQPPPGMANPGMQPGFQGPPLGIGPGPGPNMGFPGHGGPGPIGMPQQGFRPPAYNQGFRPPGAGF